jgi:hypothetical protein
MSTNLWGGAGHNEIHATVHHHHKDFCIQVTSPHVANNADWEKQGDHWAKKHHTTILDGPCPAAWGHEVHKMDHGKTHVVIFAH